MYIKARLFSLLAASDGYYLTCYVGTHGQHQYRLLKADGHTYADVVSIIRQHKLEHETLMRS